MSLSLIERQRRILERIATGDPLEDVMLLIVNLVEEQSDMRCAVLLADVPQTRLRFIAAPNIPQDYREAIEPYLRIAPNMASCGTAAFLRHPVYTRDTANDKLWDNIGGIAVRNRLRAIWSTPIVSDDNRVLGTFAMYYGTPRLPGPEHVELIDLAVQMARVAIESKADVDLIRTVFEDSLRPLLVTDLEGHIERANHAFASALGHDPAELRGRSVRDIRPREEPAVLVNEIAAKGYVANETTYRTREGETRGARERIYLRRDSSGKPRFLVTSVENFLEPDIALLSERERQVLEHVVAGLTSKEIGRQLGVAPSTVETYRRRIMRKLEVADLPALVRFAIRHGISST